MEDKIYSVALHYRDAPEKAAAFLAALRVLCGEAKEPVELLHGKSVIEVTRAEIDKGRTLRSLYMSLSERQSRHRELYAALAENNISTWGDRFISQQSNDAGGASPGKPVVPLSSKKARDALPLRTTKSRCA